MLAGLTLEEARDLLLSVGTHRGQRRLSPIEVAESFNKAIAASASPSDCAHFVNLAGPTMVSRFLRLLNLKPSIRHIVDWGQTRATIAFASAWRLGDLSEDEQEIAAREVLANQMGKEEVRQIVQLGKRSHRGIAECISEVLQMRPVITRRHVFLGAINDSEIRLALRKMKQIERDALLSTSINTIYGQLPNTSGRLGTERFTIVTDATTAARLKTENSDFEELINTELSAKVLKT